MPALFRSRNRLVFLSPLALVLLVACGDDSNGNDNGTLAVAVAPATENVAPGGSGTSAVTITRGGGFSGAVTLSQSGAPAGVTVSFTPSVIPASSTGSTVNVAVAAGTATGTHDITIRASGDDVADATATLELVIVSGDAGGFTLSASPTAITAPAGGAAVTSDITITRTAPFAGAVAFTVTGAPANVTATVAPASASGNTATLSVQAGAGAANGSYPLVIHGSGTGVPDATTTVTATVTGGAAPGISLALSPSPLPVTAGGAASTSTVTITRNGGFTGGVNLALTGAPSGMTATVAPNSNVTGNTATVTVQANNTVAANTYNLTLTGSGTGISNATATLPVTVSSGGGGGGTVTAAFCAADAPIWVAIQNGTTWTRVLPTSGSTYTFNFTASTGGIAVVDTTGTDYYLSVIFASVAEFTNVGGNVANQGCGAKTVNGSVTNYSATQGASFSLGPVGGLLFDPAPADFAIGGVPDGPQDLFASRFDIETFVPDRFIIRRDLNIADNGTIPVVDFAAAEAFNPGTANVTVANLGSDEASVFGRYLGDGSGGGQTTLISSYLAASGAVPYTAVPLLNLQAGEFQQLSSFASNASNARASRSADVYFRAPADRTLTMGPVLNTPTVTKLVSGTNARPRVQLTSQSAYNRLILAGFSTTGNGASVAATASYFTSLPATWDIQLPDFTGVAGWDPVWGLQDGTPINWAVTAQGGVVPFLDPTLTDGATGVSAQVSSASELTVRMGRFSPLRRAVEGMGKR